MALLRVIREDSLRDGGLALDAGGYDDHLSDDEFGPSGAQHHAARGRRRSGVSGVSSPLRTADLVEAVGVASGNDEVRVASLQRPSRDLSCHFDDTDLAGDAFHSDAQGRKRVIQRRFNVGVLEAIPERKASTL